MTTRWAGDDVRTIRARIAAFLRHYPSSTTLVTAGVASSVALHLVGL